MTLAGAAFADVVVANTARRLLGRETPWIPFLVAQVIAFAIANYQDQLGSFLGFVLAIINGCLIYVTAAEGNEAVASAAIPKAAGRVRRQGRQRVPWLKSWFDRP